MRFIADRNAVILIEEGTGKTGVPTIGPLRIDVAKGRELDAAGLELFGITGLLRDEDLAAALARCLNAALAIDREDLATASQALEILVSQQLALVDANDPVRLTEESMRYVLDQERWKFDLKQDKRSDGVRVALSNPNGDEVPIGIHVSNRGKTPSFWVMQENRLVQGGHAYKIPIQAATAMRQAVQEYLDMHDTGTIKPFG